MVNLAAEGKRQMINMLLGVLNDYMKHLYHLRLKLLWKDQIPQVFIGSYPGTFG